MPVIECSCGMVMSVPVGGTRVGCIRCGGVEVHVLDWRVVDPRQRDAFFPAPQDAPPRLPSGVRDYKNKNRPWIRLPIPKRQGAY